MKLKQVKVIHIQVASLALLALLAGVGIIDSVGVHLDANKYAQTTLPKDPSELWVTSGDAQSDTVLIIGEGGPKSFLDFESSGRTYWEYLPNNQKYYYVVIHQASTYNPSILPAVDFSPLDARKEVNNSTEILDRAVRHFKGKGKYVVVFGHSYSAWVVQSHLAGDVAIADKYMITGGRVDADSVQTAYQLRGVNTGWDSDGRTLLIPDEDRPPNPNRIQRYYTIRGNKELLKYAIGVPRYSKLLSNSDLSNVVYYSGQHDENVGVLSHEEIDFLESHGSLVRIRDSDHYNLWKHVIDDFRDGSLTL